MIAYHFCSGTLAEAIRRDGTILERGGTETHEGPLALCESGLHASRHPADALDYVPGPILRLVDLGGEIREGEDKLCGRTRRELARIDATRLLRGYAADCVEHVWRLADPKAQLACAGAIDCVRRGADAEEMAAARYAVCDACDPREAASTRRKWKSCARATASAASALASTVRVAVWAARVTASTARSAASGTRAVSWAAGTAERAWQRKHLRALVVAAFRAV